MRICGEWRRLKIRWCDLIDRRGDKGNCKTAFSILGHSNDIGVRIWKKRKINNEIDLDGFFVLIVVIFCAKTYNKNAIVYSFRSYWQLTGYRSSCRCSKAHWTQEQKCHGSVLSCDRLKSAPYASLAQSAERRICNPLIGVQFSDEAPIGAQPITCRVAPFR